MGRRLDIRPATAADLQALRAIYAGVVDKLGPIAYTPEQVVAWKVFASDSAFDDFILGVYTYVAVIDTDTVGFCGISEDGHVASVYVRADRCGQGVGTALLNGVMGRHPAPVSGRYYAEASAFSLPLFKRCGFRHLGNEQTTRDGVAFERFLVERVIQDAGIEK